MQEILQIMQECRAKEHELAEMMGHLTGNDFDMQAIEKWRELFMRENDAKNAQLSFQTTADAIQKLADLEEKKIIWLKRLKQAMLEKMFV